MARPIQLCPQCDGVLTVREGSDRFEVACERCSWVRGGADYLAACLGGGALGGRLGRRDPFPCVKGEVVDFVVVLDRLEDGGYAVLELPSGETVDWPRNLLPGEAEEGWRLAIRFTRAL